MHTIGAQFRAIFDMILMVIFLNLRELLYNIFGRALSP